MIDSNIENKIETIEETYIARLKDPDLIYTSSAVFGGLLSAIRNRFFSGLYMEFTPEEIQRLFIIYADLCGRYNHTMIEIAFISMIGRTADYLDMWKNSNDENRAQTAKRIGAACEASLSGRAVDHNSIGAIFTLKAKHAYRDNITVEAIQGPTAAPAISKDDLFMLSGARGAGLDAIPAYDQDKVAENL